jgi:surface antigen
MAGPVSRRAFRLPPYSGSAVASLRLAAVVLLALTGSGCAVTGQLGALFGKSSHSGADAYASGDMTGTVGSARPAAAKPVPSETDLVFARMAITEVLRHGSKDISVPWENPGSGARGTVTPIASAYVRDGVTCHDFLASYLRQGAETWMQGEACRGHKGKWEVKTLKPWTRS